MQTVRAGVRQIDGEALAAQAALQRGRQPHLVLDDQQSHWVSSLSAGSVRPGDGPACHRRRQPPVDCLSPITVLRTHAGSSEDLCRSSAVTARCAGWLRSASWGRRSRGRRHDHRKRVDVRTHWPRPPPAELLADMQSTSVKAFSGTVVTQMSLGLAATARPSPAIAVSRRWPACSPVRTRCGSGTAGRDSSGSRCSGQTSETDVFHSGRDLWEWDSDTHVATHTVLPPATPPVPRLDRSQSDQCRVPDPAAARHRSCLAAIDPTTKVTLGAKRSVADRSAYDLVLTPRDAGTRVGSVHIAVDGVDQAAAGRAGVCPRRQRAAGHRRRVLRHLVQGAAVRATSPSPRRRVRPCTPASIAGRLADRPAHGGARRSRRDNARHRAGRRGRRVPRRLRRS